MRPGAMLTERVCNPSFATGVMCIRHLLVCLPLCAKRRHCTEHAFTVPILRRCPLRTNLTLALCWVLQREEALLLKYLPSHSPTEHRLHSSEMFDAVHRDQVWPDGPVTMHTLKQHSLRANPSMTVCLVLCSTQRQCKMLVALPSPKEISDSDNCTRLVPLGGAR